MRLVSQTIYLFSVAIFECICQLVNIFCSPLLVKSAVRLLLQCFIHLTSRGKFQNKVNSGVVVKVAKHPKNMLMAEVSLNFDFSSQLMFNVGFLKLTLEEHFEGDYEL